MKPQPYDGTEDIEEYLSQFQILSEVNGWNYNIKSLCSQLFNILTENRERLIIFSHSCL
jgi:hypothetical protein